MQKEKECFATLLHEMITLQKKKLLNLAQTIIPRITEEDLLQPFDYPTLENHPYFRYEEGYLAALLSIEVAFLREIYE